MRVLFSLIMLMVIPAMAQELKPAALEPVRVSIASDVEGTPIDRDFNELLQRALNKAGSVRFTSAKFDCKVLTTSTEITERGKLTGYASAVAVLKRVGDSFSMRLHIATGPTLDRVAEDAAAWLGKELQTGRRK